jgi:DNA-directed RNA polymerase subunit K/omega
VHAIDPVFKAREILPNRFQLCVVAFERTKQLLKGAKPRAHRKWASHVSTALQEIAESRIVPGETANDFKLG